MTDKNSSLFAKQPTECRSGNPRHPEIFSVVSVYLLVTSASISLKSGIAKISDGLFASCISKCKRENPFKKYQAAYFSIPSPGVSISKNKVSQLYDTVGKSVSSRQKYHELSLKELKEYDIYFIDGTYVEDTSSVNSFSSWYYTQQSDSSKYILALSGCTELLSWVTDSRYPVNAEPCDEPGCPQARLRGSPLAHWLRGAQLSAQPFNNKQGICPDKDSRDANLWEGGTECQSGGLRRDLVFGSHSSRPSLSLGRRNDVFCLFTIELPSRQKMCQQRVFERWRFF